MPSKADPADLAFCESMLPLVSRTFAACIGLLPPRPRKAVLIGYLLCRIADTIEDDSVLNSTVKVRLLGVFRHGLDGGDTTEISSVFADHSTPDRSLTGQLARTLSVFHSLDLDHQQAIRPWVKEMCKGMADFAKRPGFGGGSATLVALHDQADLERYCWFVAGTVGHLLTDIFALEGPAFTPERIAGLRNLATSFGLGLQLVNIIKDVADDRKRNWSFVPETLCSEYRLDVAHLLDPAHRPAANQVMQRLIQRADHHLNRATRYCQILPPTHYRIRLFCLAPLFFAKRTLRLATLHPRLLDPDFKVKISRAEVKRTILLTHCIAPINPLIHLYCQHLGRIRPEGLRRSITGGV